MNYSGINIYQIEGFILNNLIWKLTFDLGLQVYCIDTMAIHLNKDMKIYC